MRADPPRVLPYGCPPVSVAETIPATFSCVSPLFPLPRCPLVDPTPADLEGIVDLPHHENPRDCYGKLKTADPPLAEFAFPEVRAIMDQFADVFPAELPLGLPLYRPTDHRIDLAEGARPPSHRPSQTCAELLADLRSLLVVFCHCAPRKLFLQPQRQAPQCPSKDTWWHRKSISCAEIVLFLRLVRSSLRTFAFCSVLPRGLPPLRSADHCPVPYRDTWQSLSFETPVSTVHLVVRLFADICYT